MKSRIKIINEKGFEENELLKYLRADQLTEPVMEKLLNLQVTTNKVGEILFPFGDPEFGRINLLLGNLFERSIDKYFDIKDLNIPPMPAPINIKIIFNKAFIKYIDGQVRLGGIGTYIGDKIYKLTQAETRVTVLGHVQRGAQPTHRDRLIASAFGVYAVDLIAQERFNRVVVWKDRGVQDVNLDNVAGYSKTVSKKDPLINVARGLGIYFGELD